MYRMSIFKSLYITILLHDVQDNIFFYMIAQILK